MGGHEEDAVRAVEAIEQKVEALSVTIEMLTEMCHNPDVWGAPGGSVEGGAVTFKGVLPDHLKKHLIQDPLTKADVMVAVAELKEQLGFANSRLLEKEKQKTHMLRPQEVLTVDELVTHIKGIFKEDTLSKERRYDPDHQVLVTNSARRKNDAGGDVFVGRDGAVQAVSESIKGRKEYRPGSIHGKEKNPLISVQQAPGFGKSLFLTRLPVEMKDSGLPETTIYCPLTFNNQMWSVCTIRPDEHWSLGWRLVFGAFKSMANCRLVWYNVAGQVQLLHWTHTCNLITFVTALQRLFGEAYRKRSPPSICVGDEEETPLTPEQCEDICVVILVDEFNKQLAAEGTPKASVAAFGYAMDALPAVFVVVSHLCTGNMFATASNRRIAPVTLGVLTTEERYQTTKDIFLPQDEKPESPRMRDWLAHLGFGHPRAIHYTACLVGSVLEDMGAKGGQLTEAEWRSYGTPRTLNRILNAPPKPIDREAVSRLTVHDMRQLTKASLGGLQSCFDVYDEPPVWVIECVLLNSSGSSIARLERQYEGLAGAFLAGMVHVVSSDNDPKYRLDVLPLAILPHLAPSVECVSEDTHPNVRLMKEVLRGRLTDELLANSSDLSEKVSALFSLLAIRNSMSGIAAGLLLPSCNVECQELQFHAKARSMSLTNSQKRKRQMKEKCTKLAKKLKAGRVKNLVETLGQKPPVLWKGVPPGVYMCPRQYPCVDYIINPSGEERPIPIGVSVKALGLKKIESLLLDLEVSRKAFQLVYPKAKFVAHVMYDIPPELKANYPWLVDASVLRSVIPASFLELASWTASNRFEEESTPTGKCLRSRPVWPGVSSGEPSRELGMHPPPPVFLPPVLEPCNPCAHIPLNSLALAGASHGVLSGQRRPLCSSAFPQRGWAPWVAGVMRHGRRLV